MQSNFPIRLFLLSLCTLPVSRALPSEPRAIPGSLQVAVRNDNPEGIRQWLARDLVPDPSVVLA